VEAVDVLGGEARVPDEDALDPVALLWEAKGDRGVPHLDLLLLAGLDFHHGALEPIVRPPVLESLGIFKPHAAPDPALLLRDRGEADGPVPFAPERLRDSHVDRGLGGLPLVVVPQLMGGARPYVHAERLGLL